MIDYKAGLYQALINDELLLAARYFKLITDKDGADYFNIGLYYCRVGEFADAYIHLNSTLSLLPSRSMRIPPKDRRGLSYEKENETFLSPMQSQAVQLFPELSKWKTLRLMRYVLDQLGNSEESQKITQRIEQLEYLI